MPVQEPYSQIVPPAPYTGGQSIGGDIFFVDGDFTSCDPCGMPVISYPMKGDSILSLNDIFVFNPDLDGGPGYQAIPIGSYPNLKAWNPNQQVAILEQEFIVAQNAFAPMPLNTPYNVAWSLGFTDLFPSGYPAFDIGSMYLVEEGELVDIGGGLSKIRRKWATLPPTRCEIEQYVAQFPGIDNSASGGSFKRPTPSPLNVMSRIQYDYFIFDDLDILDIPLFNPDATTADDAGYRLDATTGMYPPGIVIPATTCFANDNILSTGGILIGYAVQDLTDPNPDDENDTPGTIPTASDYLNYAQGLATSNGQPAEIVIEASTFTRWMGNIWERRTRFCPAQ